MTDLAAKAREMAEKYQPRARGTVGHWLTDQAEEQIREAMAEALLWTAGECDREGMEWHGDYDMTSDASALVAAEAAENLEMVFRTEAARLREVKP